MEINVKQVLHLCRSGDICSLHSLFVSLSLSLKGRWLWLQSCGFQTIFNSRQEFKITSFDCIALPWRRNHRHNKKVWEFYVSWDIPKRKQNKTKASLYSVEKIINREWRLKEEKNKSEKEKQLKCENTP